MVEGKICVRLEIPRGVTAPDTPAPVECARDRFRLRRARLPPIWIGRGPRALEALLLERVAALAAAARADPRLLAQPVRIVVPSRSLADHVGERLVSTARRLRRRAGADPVRARARDPGAHGRGAARLRMRSSRCWSAGSRREEPLLRERLARARRRLRGGRGLGRRPARRGLRRGLRGARSAKRSRSSDAYPAARERALAVARVAARCLDAMQREGIGHRSLLLRAAREALLRGSGAGAAGARRLRARLRRRHRPARGADRGAGPPARRAAC